MPLESDLRQAIDNVRNSNDRLATNADNLDLRREVCACTREAQDIFEDTSAWSRRIDRALQEELVTVVERSRDLLQVEPTQRDEKKWYVYFTKVAQRVEEIRAFDVGQLPTAITE